VAVAPMTADRILYPGQRLEDGSVVDPFRSEPIHPGERYWLCLPPGLVTSMRHHWTAPGWPALDLTGEVPAPPEDEEKRFLAKLAADHKDADTRRVYADWLYEKGRDQDAQAQIALTLKIEAEEKELAALKEESEEGNTYGCPSC
jgi:uncharacterized protein (TIGR02996 family)